MDSLGDTEKVSYRVHLHYTTREIPKDQKTSTGENLGRRDGISSDTSLDASVLEGPLRTSSDGSLTQENLLWETGAVPRASLWYSPSETDRFGFNF